MRKRPKKVNKFTLFSDFNLPSPYPNGSLFLNNDIYPSALAEELCIELLTAASN